MTYFSVNMPQHKDITTAMGSYSWHQLKRLCIMENMDTILAGSQELNPLVFATTKKLFDVRKLEKWTRV